MLIFLMEEFVKFSSYNVQNILQENPAIAKQMTHLKSSHPLCEIFSACLLQGKCDFQIDLHVKQLYLKVNMFTV